jgi:hypothetical protein
MLEISFTVQILSLNIGKAVRVARLDQDKVSWEVLVLHNLYYLTDSQVFP